MLDRLDQTIVAIATAPGHAALGIVRVSGPDAIMTANRIIRMPADTDLATIPGATRFRAMVSIGDGLTIPAIIHMFREPHSYTREDAVEIHTVGSPTVLNLVQAQAIQTGAIEAQPGEFTARAFLHGAMDLTSAEAVAGVIRAQSDTQLRAARRMSDGVLTQRMRLLRDRLAELLALVEADIDFSEEPIDFIAPTELRSRLAVITSELDGIQERANIVERFDILPRILLFGPPNAGKSALLNRLSRTRRAICAAVAGTTRDILSAPITLGAASTVSWQREAILLDAAGIDRTEDEIISQAREMTMNEAARVDLLCLVVDVRATDLDAWHEQVKSLRAPACVIAANKCDLIDDAATMSVAKRLADWNIGPACTVSALTGEGIEPLRTAFSETLCNMTTTTLGEGILITERQHRAIFEAADAVHRTSIMATASTRTIDRAELLAFELREALDALGTVTGDVTTDDLLGQVFANFCIGK